MTAPTSPPLMPPPGWYPDPEQAWTWRWWDGGRWTELRAPQNAGPVRNPYSFSVWFEQALAVFKVLFKRVGGVLLVVWGGLGLLSWLAVMLVVTSDKGREIRALLDFDETFGPTGGSTVVLTDAEADRIVDLAADLFWASLPWMIGFALLFLLAWMWSVAVAAIVGERHSGGTVADEGSPGAGGAGARSSRIDDAGEAVRRLPMVFIASIALGGILLGLVVVLALPLLFAIALDAGGGAIALTGVFAFLAAFALTVWLGVRLSLAVVIAAIGGNGIGIGRSWELTADHFWGTAGRLIVASLIAGAVTMPLSIINSFGFAFGFVAYLALLFLIQTITNIASILVSVPAQVVLIRHLGEQHTTSRG